MFVPGNANRGRSDGDATFAFLVHVIHRGVSIVDVSNRSNETGVKQHPFDGRRLAGVDVRDDAEISNAFRIDDVRRHAAATDNESQREKSHLKRFFNRVESKDGETS